MKHTGSQCCFAWYLGIFHREYLIHNTCFQMYDVGGQRNERKKWISLFDEVDALIFVVALNGFCRVLFEDENVNKMQESLKLFGEQCNSKHFQVTKTQFILFLNKNDLFRDRLKAGIDLSVCFGDEWDGNNYCDREEFESEAEREEWFEECHDEAIKFITQKFFAKNENKKITDIYVHVTTATNEDNIQTVFHDVRASIIRRNLTTIGVAKTGTTSTALY